MAGKNPENWSAFIHLRLGLSVKKLKESSRKWVRITAVRNLAMPLLAPRPRKTWGRESLALRNLVICRNTIDLIHQKIGAIC